MYMLAWVPVHVNKRVLLRTKKSISKIYDVLLVSPINKYLKNLFIFVLSHNLLLSCVIKAHRCHPIFKKKNCHPRAEATKLENDSWKLYIYWILGYDLCFQSQIFILPMSMSTPLFLLLPPWHEHTCFFLNDCR